MELLGNRTDEDRQEAFQNVMLAYHLAHLGCVPGAAEHEVLRALDDYCDSKQMHESRKPLILLGSSGTGKSALLGQWVRQRQSHVTAKKDLVGSCLFVCVCSFGGILW